MSVSSVLLSTEVRRERSACEEEARLRLLNTRCGFPDGCTRTVSTSRCSSSPRPLDSCGSWRIGLGGLGGVAWGLPVYLLNHLSQRRGRCEKL